jgi:hypothetical protein
MVALATALLIPLIVPGAPAAASTAPPPLLTYMPAGFVSSLKTDAQVDGYLTDLDTYGINEALLNLPAFKPTGKQTLSTKVKTMLPRWVARIAAFNSTHANPIALTAVFNGRVDKGLNLDDAPTRSNMVVAINTVVAKGVDGVQLDLEPYPTTVGLLGLLDAIDPSVRLSIVAPAVTTTWSPAFLQDVSARVDTVNPLYYDSGLKNVASYQSWIVASLAYYATNTAPNARVVPVVPSYTKNKWHLPAVENIATATGALSTALAANSRVNGAGIWWWWGFFYGEGGKYVPAADQAAWQSNTRTLGYN